MPENGQVESKPESKPEDKPSTSSEVNEARGRRFVKYQDLDKSELVSMLLRINKRLTRVNKELREIINILYYGNTQAPQEGGGQGNQYRKNRKNYGYRSYGKQYGYKRNRQRRSGSEDEDVNYD